MSNTIECSRCGADIEAAPAQGTTFRTMVHTNTTVVYSWFKWQFLPKDPGDQVRETYTRFALCPDCARQVLKYLQGEEA